MNDRYVAPPRAGYAHIGNSWRVNADDALREHGNKDGLIATPFYPQGKPGTGVEDKFRIRWAVYQWVGL